MRDLDRSLEEPTLNRRYDVISSSEYWRDIIMTGKVQRSPGVFWTSFPTSDAPINQQGFMQTRAWARGFFGSPNAFVMYDTASDTYVAINTIENPCDGPSEAEFNLQVRRMSKAFAAAVSGTAYLVMPDDAPIYPESVWSVWEFPMVTRNPAMDQVIRVEVPSGRQSILWSRNDGPRGQPPPPGRKKMKARFLS
ncbi:MAG: hypothetical protein Q9213_002533 [Squamulea squamosa]